MRGSKQVDGGSAGAQKTLQLNRQAESISASCAHDV
jgi:hypothetical protein